MTAAAHEARLSVLDGEGIRSCLGPSAHLFSPARPPPAWRTLVDGVTVGGTLCALPILFTTDLLACIDDLVVLAAA